MNFEVAGAGSVIERAPHIIGINFERMFNITTYAVKKYFLKKKINKKSIQSRMLFRIHCYTSFLKNRTHR
jgi:hypothetical protein